MDGNLLFETYVLYFFIYSVLGYFGEVIYCSIPAHHFVNRGFMYGPYLPIYGFGGVAIRLIGAAIPSHAASNPFLVFAFSFVSASIIEYIGSFILQKGFNVKLWDYSKHFGNINGRVCLLNSTIFGFAGLLLTYVVHPLLSQGFAFLSDALVHSLSTVVIVVMSSDATASLIRMAAFKHGLEDMKDRKAKLEERIARLRGTGEERLSLPLRAKLEEESAEFREQFNLRYRRFVSKFPTMTSGNIEMRQQIENMKDAVLKHLPRKGK
jgi:uncharacterized membrane protein